MTLTYGSLFSGAGGFDLGFDAAGWSGEWQVENDKFCQGVLRRHWPNTTLYGDIAEVSGADIKPVDAILFGFPCQDVSTAQFTHMKSGLSGERSSLFFEAVRVIKEMRDATDNAYPRYAVAENVVGLLGAESGRSFLRAFEALVELGAMAVEWRVLDAQDFGLGQRRRRVFLIANFNSGAGRGRSIFPQPRNMSRHHSSNQRKNRIYPSIDDGSNGQYLIINRLADHGYAEGVVASPILSSGFGRNQTYVVKNCGSPTIRRLTPLEGERLQGWPDFHTAFSDSGVAISNWQRYKMIGNGVASPCAAWVASRIAEYDATYLP